MDQKNNGGAAFPQHGWSRDPEANKYMQDKGGMTLRDYFAAQALPAILSVPDDGIQAWSPTATSGSSITAAEAWAKNAYQIADAMLAERAK